MEITWGHKFRLAFTSTKTWTVAVLVAAVALCVVAVDAWGLDGSVSTWWTRWADPMVGFVTLLIAIGLWFRNRVSSWEQGLPHLLSVSFVTEGKTLLTIVHAPLSGPSDIRLYSQALGKAANDGSDLDLAHNNTITGPVIVEVNNRHYRQWVCKCPLRTRPSHFPEHPMVYEFAPHTEAVWTKRET